MLAILQPAPLKFSDNPTDTHFVIAPAHPKRLDHRSIRTCNRMRNLLLLNILNTFFSDECLANWTFGPKQKAQEFQKITSETEKLPQFATVVKNPRFPWCQLHVY
jgi:hypothetical protein